MLGKEVAEERAELADTELKDVQAMVAVLEVETNVLKEGSVKISLFHQTINARRLENGMYRMQNIDIIR